MLTNMGRICHRQIIGFGRIKWLLSFARSLKQLLAFGFWSISIKGWALINVQLFDL